VGIVLASAKLPGNCLVSILADALLLCRIAYSTIESIHDELRKY